MNENVSHDLTSDRGLLEPFVATGMFPKSQRRPRVHPGQVGRPETAEPQGGAWPTSLSRSTTDLRPPPRLRERILLADNWHVHWGDPCDADTLGSAPLRQLRPVSGAFLSALEDDSAPDVSRGSRAERNVGRDVSWVQPDFDDTHWNHSSLSHDCTSARLHAAIVDPVMWYRRSFVVPSSDWGRQIYLELDGDFAQSLVWLNGQCMGKVGAYATSFRRDLTPHLVVGSQNTLVLRVEGSSASSTSGPILSHERTVHLVKTNALHLGPEGNSVKGRLRSGDKADLAIYIPLQNRERNARRGSLTSTLLDPAGRALAAATQQFHIFGQDRSLCRLTLSFADAEWLLSNPGHYFAQTTMVVDGLVHDEAITSFDLRAALCSHLPDQA